MGVTQNYSRDKDPSTNVTGIALRAKAAEGVAATPLDLAGADGIVQIAFDGDADAAAGTVLEDLFRVDNLQVSLGSDGAIRLVGTVVVVLGDGSDGASTAINVAHSQNMDAWQAAAGIAQQP